MAGNNGPVAHTPPPLRNRFKASLALAGQTVASWARSKGYIESLVWMNLSGARHTPDIRASVAQVLGMGAEALDVEIARERAERTAENGSAA